MGFFDIIKTVLRRHEPLRINHREGDVVILSEDDYDSLLETLELLSSPGFKAKYKKSKQQIKNKQLVPMAKVFGD